MRDFCKISPLVWRSEKFGRLSDPDRLLYFYFLTAPHANSCGCYVIPMGYMEVDTGWKQEALRKGIERVSDTLLIRYEAAKNVVYVANWFHFNPPANPNHANKVLNDLLAIPDCSPKFDAIIDFSDCCEARGWSLKTDPRHTLPEGYRKGIERVSPPDQTRPDRDQTETPPSKKKALSKSEFIAHPLNGEINEWFKTKSPSVNPHALRDILVTWHEAKGKPVKDWMATLKNWALRKHNENVEKGWKAPVTLKQREFQEEF